MRQLGDWPAFSEGVPEKAALTCGRALRGKVHRVRTDYRWIAASPGLDPEALGLAERLALGWEDQPCPIFAWAPVPDGYAAMTAYPSRTRDADGRPGGLEKQILVWHPTPGVPAAAAAFLLLLRVASLPDSLAAGLWGGPEWTSNGYRHTFAPEDSPDISFDESALAVAIEEGRKQLSSQCTEDAVARLYTQVLEERRPAILSGISGELSPVALAALLLPLPLERIAGFSITSGVPARQFDGASFSNWAAVCASHSVDVAPSDLAAWMAHLLWSGPPTAFSISCDRRASAAAKLLHEYLRSNKRKFPDLPPGLNRSCKEDEAHALVFAIREFDAGIRSITLYPSDLERREALSLHLKLKSDLSRAWLYAIAPYDFVVDEVPPSEAALVPPLHFAVDAWLGPHTLSKVNLAKLRRIDRSK